MPELLMSAVAVAATGGSAFFTALQFQRGMWDIGFTLSIVIAI